MGGWVSLLTLSFLSQSQLAVLTRSDCSVRNQWQGSQPALVPVSVAASLIKELFTTVCSALFMQYLV